MSNSQIFGAKPKELAYTKITPTAPQNAVVRYVRLSASGDKLSFNNYGILEFSNFRYGILAGAETAPINFAGSLQSRRVHEGAAKEVDYFSWDDEGGNDRSDQPQLDYAVFGGIETPLYSGFEVAYNSSSCKRETIVCGATTLGQNYKML